MEKEKILIEIPKPVHDKILQWAGKSNIDVSEYLRLALMMGAMKLAEDVQVKDIGEGYYN
jgi:hypothetical protein